MLYIYPFLVLGFPFVVWPREVHALAFLPAGFHHCIYSGPICLGGQGTGVLCSKFSLGLNWSLHLCKHRLYMSYLPCWSWGSGLCMYSWIFLWERCWGLFLFVLFFSQLCWISFNVLRPQVTVFFTAFSRQCKDCYLNGRQGDPSLQISLQAAVALHQHKDCSSIFREHPVVCGEKVYKRYDSFPYFSLLRLPYFHFCLHLTFS